MAKHYEPRPALACTAITCDRCKKKYEDIFEIQEFLSWRMEGGYGNVTFGDMTLLELDICQYCTKEVLGEWIRISTHLRDEWIFPVFPEDTR